MDDHMSVEEAEKLCLFDFGIQHGSLTVDLDHVWLANEKEGLQIKNIKDLTRNQMSAATNQHHFGIATANAASNQQEKYELKLVKDFDFKNQRYFVILLEVNSNGYRKKPHHHQQILVLYKLSTSKVIAAFDIGQSFGRVTQLQVLVNNGYDFIGNDKNPTFLRNFDVSLVCASVGGNICLFDITPSETLISLQSNEYAPLEIYWTTAVDLTDYDEIQHQRLLATRDLQKILGIKINNRNETASVAAKTFKYQMPDESVAVELPRYSVEITCLKYEKQIDSLVVGFNFGCFQIWNMKTLSIESSSEYDSGSGGENSSSMTTMKPIVGFSLMQPQNDPKKCVYLMIAYSMLRNRFESSSKKTAKNNNDLETDDDDDAPENAATVTADTVDTSFIIVYQLMFGKRVNIYLNQKESYMLYENMNYCALMFEHTLTNQTLKCAKNNYCSNSGDDYFGDDDNDSSSTSTNHNQYHSKIISIQSISSLLNDHRLQMDLTCIIWTLIDKRSPNTGVSYFMSVFNLDNWYTQCMPSKMRPLANSNNESLNIKQRRKNSYFTNYSLLSLASITDLESIKFVQVVEAKIKRMKNNFCPVSVSSQNPLRNILNQMHRSSSNLNGENESRRLDDDEEEDDDDEEEEDDENDLSMNFDLLVLTSFNLVRVSIQPIEQQMHVFLSKQDDLIHFPDRAYNLLSRYHLFDKYKTTATESASGSKFVPVLNYLLETSQIYPILKSLWKLNASSSASSSVSFLSSSSAAAAAECSPMRVVLDWAWSRVRRIKEDTNNLYQILSIKAHSYLNHHRHYHYQYNNNKNSNNNTTVKIDKHHLTELLSYNNLLLENLVQIFKQFIKMQHTTSEGHAELNKKLCVIQSIKCFTEHLQLFHKFELILPPPPPLLSLNDTVSSFHSQSSSSNLNNNHNYMNEMDVNFQVIKKRWITRRAEQSKLREEAAERQQEVVNQNKHDHDHNTYYLKYPFTYMIDCIIEECKLYAITTSSQSKSLSYPPESLFELLELCLQCNLSTQMKQIVILYVLCDLMHTEVAPQVQTHLLKLINAYCSTSFTLLSTQLDAAIGLPWSSTATSIVSLSRESKNSNNNNNDDESSCLFDLVNGLYLIDSKLIERALKYLRVTDLSYLESYEKYFILYNSMHAGECKLAAQYLWLFQKVPSLNVVDTTSSATTSKEAAAASNNNNNNKFFFKSTPSTSSESSESANYEQRMHMRLLITIYLANRLVNEAYELIKLQQQQPFFSSTTGNNKLNKEMIVHFFVEAQRYKQLNQVTKLLSSHDSELLAMFFSYLEARQDLSSIAIAIDLHVNNRNYSKAIAFYEKYSKQINNSNAYKYLASTIEIARSMVSDTSMSMSSSSSKYKISQQLISANDIKENEQFVYKFVTPFQELCKYSRRCIYLLKPANNGDEEYIKLLNIPFTIKEAILEQQQQQQNDTELKENKNEMSLFPGDGTPASMLFSKSTSIAKRKASTPHPHSAVISLQLKLHHQHHQTPPILKSVSNNNQQQQSGGGTKSVKFQLSKFTRQISDDEEENSHHLKEEEHENENSEVECKKLFVEDEEEQEKGKIDHRGYYGCSGSKKFVSLSDTFNVRRSKTPEIVVQHLKQQQNYDHCNRKSLNLIDLQTPSSIMMNNKSAEKISPSPSKSASTSFYADSPCASSFRLSLSKTMDAFEQSLSSSSPAPSHSPIKSFITITRLKEQEEVAVRIEEAAASNAYVQMEQDDDYEVNEQETGENAAQDLLNYSNSRKSIRISELFAGEHRAAPEITINQQPPIFAAAKIVADQQNDNDSELLTEDSNSIDSLAKQQEPEPERENEEIQKLKLNWRLKQ